MVTHAKATAVVWGSQAPADFGRLLRADVAGRQRAHDPARRLLLIRTRSEPGDPRITPRLLVLPGRRLSRSSAVGSRSLGGSASRISTRTGEWVVGDLSRRNSDASRNSG